MVVDRGGAIKRRKIDVFFNQHERASIFGRKKANVFWLMEHPMKYVDRRRTYVRNGELVEMNNGIPAEMYK